MNSIHIAVLWCLNGQWKIKTSLKINPIADCIKTFTHVREGSIKMDLREIGLERVDWILVAQDRDKWRFLTNAAINFALLTTRGISTVAE
jgi:hypothetical protein